MPEISRSRYLTTAGWDDVPHLSAEDKAEMLETTPPYLREARSQGIPSLGAGAIYPVSPSDVWVAPFRIPDYWPRCFAFDVGWRRTAGLWLAWDPNDGVCYPYQEYYAAHQTPVTHAQAVKLRGDWIPGVIDPASNQSNQKDGTKLMDLYKGLGLRLSPAENAVESGIYEVWSALSTGMLRPFKTLENFWMEYRIYRRNEKGRIVKEYDHLMDCLRYGYTSGKAVARVRPVQQAEVSGPSIADPVSGY